MTTAYTEERAESRRKYYSAYTNEELVDQIISYARNLEKYQNAGWQFNVDSARAEVLERLARK